VRKCMLQGVHENVGTRSWSNMGGEIHLQQVQLTNAYLGPAPWDEQDVFVLPDDGNRPAGLHGLLGVSCITFVPSMQSE
jgi:hypothetical protein